MSFFLVDDAFPMHPKVVELLSTERTDRGEARYRAIALWTLAGAHCKRSRTSDGSITAGQAKMLLNCNLRRAREAADALVSVGLWVMRGDVYAFRDWGHWQSPGRRQVEAAQTASSRQVDGDEAPGSGRVDAGQAPSSCHVDAGEVSAPLNDFGDLREPLTHAGERALVPLPSPVPDPLPDPERERTRATGRGPIGDRAERLRVGYVERFERACPGVGPDAVAQSGSGGPWLNVARQISDDQADRLLDAYFADEWCRETGYRPRALESERVRLLTNGPTLAKPSGPRRVEPASHDEVRKRVEREAGKGATHVRHDL